LLDGSFLAGSVVGSLWWYFIFPSLHWLEALSHAGSPSDGSVTVVTDVYNNCDFGDLLWLTGPVSALRFQICTV
jgi:hypothetical protein